MLASREPAGGAKPSDSKVPAVGVSWSSVASSEGFSTKSTIRPDASTCMMPNAGAWWRAIGFTAIVRSASASRWVRTKRLRSMR